MPSQKGDIPHCHILQQVDDSYWKAKQWPQSEHVVSHIKIYGRGIMLSNALQAK